MRMRWFTGAAVLLAIGVPAIADEGKEATATIAERYQAEFADCVVARRRYKAPVETFLRQIPETDVWGDAAFKAADLTCLNAAASRTHSVITMKMQPASFRDALYPALYRQQFSRAPQTARIGTLPPLDLKGEFAGDIAALPAEYKPRRALGDCIARAEPQAVHSLLLAKPVTPMEDAAVAALKPAIAACLPAGTTLRMNRAALRAYTGEAMFKLSSVAVSAPTPAAG